MQLNRDMPVRGALAALTAALLGHSGTASAEPTHTETSFLVYSESQRVTAGEAVFRIRRPLSEPYALRLNLQVDGLTGASPNGATPSRQPQTFTRPSGNGSFTVAPGETPLDPEFRDKRFALDAELSRVLDRMTSLTLGGHGSVESDYSSFGITSGITRDFNRKNTTIGLSGSIAFDVARPAGGSHIPFTPMVLPSEGGNDDGNDRKDDDDEESEAGYEPKNVYDLVFGISQVIDRRTIIRLNYSFDRSSGYLTDPYKLITVVQGRSSPDPGEPLDYVYEGRPASRNKNAVYAQFLRYIGGSVFDLSFRHFWDDWGITSQTVDFFWELPVGRRMTLQPHGRWYRQSQANFYRAFLEEGAPFPEYASADARLAKFDAFTYGLKYTLPVFNGSHLSATAEYYYQKGDSSPPEAFGSLRGYDLFPELKALMLRIGFSHDL